ncbi:MAG TPA: CerR family C-terminal domain-containing protein [Albitalea sp.]|nr:CerR family C-terminal domain-containing protein [Albitalea sp.]
MNAAQLDQAPDTRLRLIEAASEIFIERGFKAAKIRDIVERAKTNLAAINYHFGGKEALYAAVIQHNATLAIQDMSPAVSEAAPEQQLRLYVRTFLKRLLDNNIQSRMSKLIAHEVVEPTAAFDLVLEQFAVPLHRTLNGIVRAILEPNASEETVRRCSMSIIGQCLYYQKARRAVQRLDPDFSYGPASIERLADHITDFSLGGLRALAQKRPV